MYWIYQSWARSTSVTARCRWSNGSVSCAAAGAQTPNVVGRKLGDAVGVLQAAGFARVAWDVGQGPGGACAVVRQDPAAGTTIARGATATLFYVAGKDCTKKGD